MFVKEITLKNFKSFKSAQAVMSNGFNCIVGPNGSGKSNIIDGLLFVFGESSLKSMRVKRIPDLIYQSHDAAEVSVVLEGSDGTHSIKRLIRRDGKTKYKLDGKTTKKYVVQELLAQNHLSLHNIIKQGEVQRIIDMSSKDRRALIDSVANVSEYEQKKQEAFAELEKVQERLREATAILNEREGFLQGLEKEKADAEKYLELKKQLDVVKASILSIDLSVLSKEFESSLAAVIDFQNKIDAVKKAITEIDAKISAKLQEKQLVHEQIMQRSQGRQLVLEKEVQELSSAIERAMALIGEKKAQIQRNEAKIGELKLDVTRAGDEVRGAAEQLRAAREELGGVQRIYEEEKAKYERMLKDTASFTKEFFKAKQELEKANAEMQAVKDQLNTLQAEVSLARETAKMKEAEMQR
ncbi:MAG: AAA family ATPase, partial [Candidatus Norongarragalinales archaeon]